MTVFVITVALMCALAVVTLVVPLVKGGRNKKAALLAASALPLLAVAAYLYFSSWPWSETSATASASAAPNSAPAANVAIGTLQDHLLASPDDFEAWMKLGRSYLRKGRTDEAIDAFVRANELSGGKNVSAALSLGWAISLRDNGHITGQADELFERAVTLAPHDPQALYLSGLAAAQRGDKTLARSRWQQLKTMRLTPKLAALLDGQLAALDEGAGSSPIVGPGDRATVNLVLAKELASRVSHDTPLFVVARLPHDAGAPLAVKRLTTAALGSEIVLTPADAMVPGREILPSQQIIITARIAFNGQAAASKGDLYGQLAYKVGTDGTRDLVIDQVF